MRVRVPGFLIMFILSIIITAVVTLVIAALIYQYSHFIFATLTFIPLYAALFFISVFCCCLVLTPSLIKIVKKTSNFILNSIKNFIDKLIEVLNLMLGIIQSLVEYLIQLIWGLSRLEEELKKVFAKVLRLLEYLLSLLSYYIILGIKELIDWIRKLIKDILDYLEDLDSKNKDTPLTKSINFFNLLILYLFFLCFTAVYTPVFI